MHFAMMDAITACRWSRRRASRSITAPTSSLSAACSTSSSPAARPSAALRSPTRCARRTAARLAEIAELLAETLTGESAETTSRASAGALNRATPAALTQDTALPTASWVALQETNDDLREDASLGSISSVSPDPTPALRAQAQVPAEPVAFALALHQAVEHKSGPAAAQVGVALGGVLVRPRPDGSAEVAGPVLEVARLLAPRASGRQTLLDRFVFDLARGALAPAALTAPGVRCLTHGAFVFEGPDAPLEVCEVGVDGAKPLAPPAVGALTQGPLARGGANVPPWRPATGQPVPWRPNWRLVVRLGEGGFGEVRLARHKSGEERVYKLCFEPERLRALKREVTLFRLLRENLGQRHDVDDPLLERPPEVGGR